MAKKRIRKNDEVLIITGKHKGQTGRVLKVLDSQQKVTVDKINIVKKHVKPTQINPEGGIREMEAPIHISNVKIYNKSTKKEEKIKAKNLKDKSKSQLELSNSKKIKSPSKKIIKSSWLKKKKTLDETKPKAKKTKKPTKEVKK